MSQLLGQCAVCRRLAGPGGRVFRSMVICEPCWAKGVRVAGGVAAVTGKMLERQAPVVFQLAKSFWDGYRNAGKDGET